MPADATSQAPVNDANGSGVMTRQYIGGGGQQNSYKAFSGSGMTFGSTTNAATAGGNESEQEKQERIRQARLARIGGGAPPTSSS